jgi:hypothetical protein
MSETKIPRFRPAPPSSVADLMLKPERPLPDGLRHDWQAIEKLIKEASPQKLQTLCEVLDAINWALIEADSIEDARLFVEKATRFADAGQASAQQAPPSNNFAAIDQLLSLVAKIQRRIAEAIGLLDLGDVNKGRALLDACVVSLDRLDMRPLDQR